MNLVVDIGNSRMKVAVFSGGEIVERWTFGCREIGRFDEIFSRYAGFDRAILSSTRDENPEPEEMLRCRSGYFLKFANTVPVPLENGYGTPHTLGCDRLAAAVGGVGMLPGRNLMIVDFGSAITCDIVTAEGRYLGGSISPGLGMRFRSLADYTDRLPLLEAEACVGYEEREVPSSTVGAMVSGVAGGIELEIRGRMERYAGEFAGLTTIFTGGDAPLFEKRFKNTIFAIIMRIDTRVYKAVLSFLLSCLPLAVSAQSSSINTFSPYSYYGIGDIMAQGPSFSRAMGGVGLGFRSPIAINSLNPASYSAINRQTALFQVGLYGQNYYLRSQDTKSSYNTFNVSEIALQLPIAEGLGFTVGISPFSSVGYRITQSEEGSDVWEEIGYVHYLYSGSGGINSYRAGLGYAVTDWLSLGAEMIYYQGNITRNFQQTVVPVTGSGYYLGMSSDNQEHVSRVFADFGLQARLWKKNNRTLNLGISYSMGGRLNSRVSEVVMHGPYFSAVGYDKVVDRQYRSDFRLPDIFRGGLYYQAPKFSAGLDYSYGSWSVNGADDKFGVRYRNTHTVAAGIQFIPNPGDVRKVMNRWSYRLGARYDQYYMVIGGHNIDEAAVTFGVGIPLGTRGVNNVNVGFEFGTRGRAVAGLVRENYFKVSVGLSLFGDDYWFVKYKYD